MYGVQKYVYVSVPRAVMSAALREARSLPLTVLIQRAFPYTQPQTDLNDRRGRPVVPTQERPRSQSCIYRHRR